MNQVGTLPPVDWTALATAPETSVWRYDVAALRWADGQSKVVLRIEHDGKVQFLGMTPEAARTVGEGLLRSADCADAQGVA